jgi:hypothetical protein
MLATSVQSPGLITSVQAGTTSKSRQRATCSSPESFEIPPAAPILLPHLQDRQRKITVLWQKFEVSAGVPAVPAPTCPFASSESLTMATRRQFLLQSGMLAGLVQATSAPGSDNFITRSDEDESARSGPSGGPWRRLFLDAAAVEQQRGLRRVFHAATPFDGNPVFSQDLSRRALGAINGPCVYGTVMREAGRFRMWYQLLLDGNHVGYAESVDGIRWTAPDLGIVRGPDGESTGLVAVSRDGLEWRKILDGPVFGADDLDPSATQIYGMPVFAWQGLYPGMPWVYAAQYYRYGEYSVDKLHDAQRDSPRTIDVQLAWSWDPVSWNRPPERQPLIARGAAGSWDSGMIVTARAPVVVGDEPKVRAAIGLAKLRLDGFCSMQTADANEGWLLTRREPCSIPRVTINARTQPGGAVTAEIVDRRGRVVRGFGREDCLGFQGDSVRHELTWRTPQFPQAGFGDYRFRFFCGRRNCIRGCRRVWTRNSLTWLGFLTRVPEKMVVFFRQI